MNIIIDTHVFLWALAEPGKLNDAQRATLEDLANTIYVSAVTIAELMIKTSIGKLEIDFDPVELSKKSGFALLDFSSEAALLLKNLPFHHKDPFDRMLIVQSLSNNFPIMTQDPKFAQYGCQVL
jgi:PIN domain nuclease of toxin-antitoxin system